MTTYNGHYILETLTFINNIPNVYGSEVQRTIVINGSAKIIPTGYYTLDQLTAKLDELVKEIVSTGSVVSDKVSRTTTYSDTSSLTITIIDPILQEVLGLTTQTGTTFNSNYMNLCPYPYIGVKIADFTHRYTESGVDYTVHIVSDVPYGSVIEYKEHEVLTANGAVGLVVTFHSRGRTFTVPFHNLQISSQSFFL